MSWERTILGRPGEHLGPWRWPVGAVGGVAIAVLAALTGEWTWAVVAGALAVVSALLTVWSFR